MLLVLLLVMLMLLLLRHLSIEHFQQEVADRHGRLTL